MRRILLMVFMVVLLGLPLNAMGQDTAIGLEDGDGAARPPRTAAMRRRRRFEAEAKAEPAPVKEAPALVLAAPPAGGRGQGVSGPA